MARTNRQTVQLGRMIKGKCVKDLCVVFALIFVSASTSRGQTAEPAFDVATIKPSAPTPGPRDRTAFASHGVFASAGLSVTALMSIAYRVQGYQITGGPRWAYTDRYDIVAKTEEDAGNDRVWLMVQGLLADRFKLAFHRETKELPVYALVVAKGGPTMTKTAADAQSAWMLGKGQWRVNKRDMAHLAGSLTREVGRTVIDMTGLTGDYDFTLDWSVGDGSDSDRPSIFTALEQQLGLKLESRKHPTEMLMIDHVERPSEN